MQGVASSRRFWLNSFMVKSLSSPILLKLPGPIVDKDWGVLLMSWRSNQPRWHGFSTRMTFWWLVADSYSFSMLIQADFIEHYMNVTLKMQNPQEAKTFQYFSHRNVVSETRWWPTRSNHLNQPRNFVITQCSCFPSLQPSESNIWETKSKGSGYINTLRSIEFASTLWKIISSTWQLPNGNGKSSSKPPFLCCVFSLAWVSWIHEENWTQTKRPALLDPTPCTMCHVGGFESQGRDLATCGGNAFVLSGW